MKVHPSNDVRPDLEQTLAELLGLAERYAEAFARLATCEDRLAVVREAAEANRAAKRALEARLRQMLETQPPPPSPCHTGTAATTPE